MRSRGINPPGLAIGIFGVVLLTKAASYLTPYKLYFSFSSFLFDRGAPFRWESLAIKLLIPCIVGFALFYAPFQWFEVTRGRRFSFRKVRYLGAQVDVTARAAGFLSALLLAWPFIVYWDVLMHPAIQHLRVPFLIVYFLYSLSYAYFAGFGVQLARITLRKALPAGTAEHASAAVRWAEAVRTSLVGLVTSGIATYLAARLGQL
jgi:hypothetical protein